MVLEETPSRNPLSKAYMVKIARVGQGRELIGLKCKLSICKQGEQYKIGDPPIIERSFTYSA
jgi:hypothetical protein